MDYPYGEERWSGGTLPTDYRFTDQRREPELAIYHMGARWFDSYLSRWLSADSIVTDPNDPQSLDRYTWVLGNPLKYRDPSGHVVDSPDVVPEQGQCKYCSAPWVWPTKYYSPNTRQKIEKAQAEQAEIEQMLDEIAETDPGYAMVDYVRDEGWTIRYGKPMAGGAFTYWWKVITVRRDYSYQTTRSMLAHELTHAAVYGGTPVNSIQQEFEAEYYEKCMSAQLGTLARDRQQEWFGPDADPEQRRANIRTYSLWHFWVLPEEQPLGVPVIWQTAWQGLTFLMSWLKAPL